jgi:eukaryotic-like serine/threonine-protein kinase
MSEVLAEFDMKIAATPVRAVASILWRRFRLRVRGLHTRPRDASEIVPRELARVDALWACTVGLGLIDTVRGEELASRHMLAALELGEPLRMARALAGEATYVASNMGVHNKRLPKVIALSDELARRTDDPRIIGLALVSRTLAAVAHNRWRDARRESMKAEEILRDRCTGVTWELSSSRLGGLAAMYYLGEIRETTQRLPTLLADADQRDDLFTVIGLATWPGNIMWLAADDATTARRRLVDAMSRWSWKGFHWQHCTELFAHGQIDLYLGDGAAAWKRIEMAWPALEKSFLLRVRNLRVTAHHLRARAAIAIATPSTEQKAAARKAAAILEKEDLPSTLGLACTVRAGLATHDNDRDRAVAMLGAAVDAFETAEMASYAAAARRQRGELLGGADGKALVDTADAYFAREGVQRPAQLAAMLAPLCVSHKS